MANNPATESHSPNAAVHGNGAAHGNGPEHGNGNGAANGEPADYNAQSIDV